MKLLYTFTLKMGAASSSVTSMYIFQTRLPHIPVDSNLHNYRRENLKPHTKCHSLTTLEYGNEDRALKGRDTGRLKAAEIKFRDLC
jgi:hypothetical protein